MQMGRQYGLAEEAADHAAEGQTAIPMSAF